jgi:MFS family permease
MNAATRERVATIVALGIAQILAWGSSFYFPAVLAIPIVADTGWPLSLVVGGVTIGLLVGGLISPKVGALIGRHGGRPVLAASSVLFACGLAAIGLSPSLLFYLAGWVLVGLGMGTGLYDAVFAALGRRYGHAARGPITHLTLFGGFASTVCWPLSAFLVESAGWRATCLVYAGLHLAIALPLQLYAMRNATTADGAEAEPASSDPRVSPPQVAPDASLLVLIALILSIAAGVGSIVVVHLLIMLQARGLDATEAVAIGTLFGPAQVGARLVETLFGRNYHPLWTLVAALVLMALGLALLLPDRAPVVLAVILYAAGYGISWIARGTLPLALFGPARYPQLIGAIAMPSLIVQALAPIAGAFAIEHYGTSAAIAGLLAFAALNITLMVGMTVRIAALRIS